MSGTPIRVAVVNDYELVVVGIAGILQRFPDQIDVVELDSGTVPEAEVDVVLYDSFGQAQGAALDIASLVGQTSAKVVVFSWNTQPDLVEQSIAAGADGYISKSVSGDDLVKQIAMVHAGETVLPQDEDVDGAVGRWPGDEHGLSPREAEVLALICQGLSNDDICNRAFLSINTVKTYVRTLYRKIGVDSRTQAVLWGIDHGFRPDRVRQRLDTGERNDH
jgi:NarL family two-component system response regulator LiaR